MITRRYSLQRRMPRMGVRYSIDLTRLKVPHEPIGKSKCHPVKPSHVPHKTYYKYTDHSDCIELFTCCSLYFQGICPCIHYPRNTREIISTKTYACRYL